MTNDARCTREIKKQHCHCKRSVGQEGDCRFHKRIARKFEEETNAMPRLELSFLWCGNLDTTESRSEVTGEVRIALQGKEG